MKEWIARTLTMEVGKLAQQFPIIAITGPRQSGKTTLLKILFPEYTYVSLENPDNRAFAAEDPNGFLRLYKGKVILDEVQHVPELFSYLKTIVESPVLLGHSI